MARKPAFIRWSREKEARVQSRMLDVLERRFARRAAQAVAAESMDLIAAYRELGFVPPARDEHFAAIRDLYRDIALQSARTFGRRIVSQGKDAGILLEWKQEEDGGFARFFRGLANAWINLEPIRRRITSVSETTRDIITRRVAKGQDAGESIDAISSGIIKDLPSISKRRGALIARTETHGAANFAMHATAKSTGLDLIKEWVATGDHRTRSIVRDDSFDHLAMDGQKRPMDEPFEMPWLGGGGEPLKIMYPGEAGHPGGATINCRCVSIHKVNLPDD